MIEAAAIEAVEESLEKAIRGHEAVIVCGDSALDELAQTLMTECWGPDYVGGFYVFIDLSVKGQLPSLNDIFNRCEQMDIIGVQVVVAPEYHNDERLASLIEIVTLLNSHRLNQKNFRARGERNSLRNVRRLPESIDIADVGRMIHTKKVVIWCAGPGANDAIEMLAYDDVAFDRSSEAVHLVTDSAVPLLNASGIEYHGWGSLESSDLKVPLARGAKGILFCAQQTHPDMLINAESYVMTPDAFGVSHHFAEEIAPALTRDFPHNNIGHWLYHMARYIWPMANIAVVGADCAFFNGAEHCEGFEIPTAGRGTDIPMRQICRDGQERESSIGHIQSAAKWTEIVAGDSRVWNVSPRGLLWGVHQPLDVFLKWGRPTRVEIAERDPRKIGGWESLRLDEFRAALYRVDLAASRDEFGKLSDYVSERRNANAIQTVKDLRAWEWLEITTSRRKALRVDYDGDQAEANAEYEKASRDLICSAVFEALGLIGS